jgi:hypothetical protein
MAHALSGFGMIPGETGQTGAAGARNLASFGNLHSGEVRFEVQRTWAVRERWRKYFTARLWGVSPAGRLVSYGADLLVSFPRPSSGFLAVAAIPAARSFAIRLMSFTGTGSVSGKWTVPFRSS